jgi:hypothetical protein
MRICFVVMWMACCVVFTGCGHKKTETIELSLKEATGALAILDKSIGLSNCKNEFLQEFPKGSLVAGMGPKVCFFKDPSKNKFECRSDFKAYFEYCDERPKDSSFDLDFSTSVFRTAASGLTYLAGGKGLDELDANLNVLRSTTYGPDDGYRVFDMVVEGAVAFVAYRGSIRKIDLSVEEFNRNNDMFDDSDPNDFKLFLADQFGGMALAKGNFEVPQMFSCRNSIVQRDARYIYKPDLLNFLPVSTPFSQLQYSKFFGGAVDQGEVEIKESCQVLKGKDNHIYLHTKGGVWRTDDMVKLEKVYNDVGNETYIIADVTEKGEIFLQKYPRFYPYGNEVEYSEIYKVNASKKADLFPLYLDKRRASILRFVTVGQFGVFALPEGLVVKKIISK